MAAEGVQEGGGGPLRHVAAPTAPDSPRQSPTVLTLPQVRSRSPL
jgi:hypothetical protein